MVKSAVRELEQDILSTKAGALIKGCEEEEVAESALVSELPVRFVRWPGKQRRHIFAGCPQDRVYRFQSA